MDNTQDGLIKSFQRASLNDVGRDPDQLLFEPPSGSRASQSLGNIPPYLFRVVSPKSAGETNGTWARSESACQQNISSSKDIFSFKCLEDWKVKAFELNVHLQWYNHKCEAEDNFVSWTSSLLFAIQYIYYRHYHDTPSSSLNDIKLYVINTSLFREGTFMRDLDLIESFCKFDRETIRYEYWNLRDLQYLRTKKGFYFGEYLSQGSLKIENKFQVIPANVLFENNRLQRLQPAFHKLYVPPPRKQDTEWANAVMNLRKDIWAPNLPVLSSVSTLVPLAAIKEILDNIDTHDSNHGWRFPLGIYLATFIGSGLATDSHIDNNGIFFEYFRSATWGGKFGSRYSRHEEDLGY
ncbi:hypothetical protein N7475_001589 [Penicillium sp. IBT 31633x]|nr:hypothetical protein N7475_001589 [Penicillium sp. IBT 31633x]